MTRHIGLAALTAMFLSTYSPEIRANQRSRVPPADAGGGGDTRTAQPREAEPRRAEPRPAEAPAAEAPASKPKIEPAPPAPASSRPSGPVVITPTVVTPSSVGGVTIGKSFSVGSSFSVGHEAPAPDTSSSGGSRRHDRDSGDRTIVVPVPVYVPVPVDDAEADVVPLPASASPSFTASAVSGLTRSTRQINVPRSYFTFTPWYNVDGNIIAGRPVPLPSPSAFAEGNISDTVAETRRETSGTTETVSVVGYAKDVGGIAFSVTPVDAGVYIDGRFVGSTSDYSPQHEPLLLSFGVYNVELRAQGYVTERFEAYVTAGEVVPFSGGMAKVAP